MIEIDHVLFGSPKLLPLWKKVDEKIVLYQGLLHPGRCLEELVLAAQFLPSNISLVFIGAGDEDYKDRLKRLIENHNLSSRVFLHYRVPYDQVFAYTCCADVGVLFYSNDGRNNYYCAPNKLFEYFRAGLLRLEGMCSV